MATVKIHYKVGNEGGATRALVEIMAHVNRDTRLGRVKSSGREASVIHYLRKLYGAASLLSPKVHPEFQDDLAVRETFSKHYLLDQFNSLVARPLFEILDLFRQSVTIDDIQAILARLDVLRKRDARGFFASCSRNDLLGYSLLDWENDVVVSFASTGTNGYTKVNEYISLVDELLVRTLKQRKLEGSGVTPEVLFGIFGMGKCLVHIAALYLPSSSVHQAAALLLSPHKKQSGYLVLPDVLGQQELREHYKWLDEHWATTSFLHFKLGGNYEKTFAWLQNEFKTMSLEAFTPFQLEMGLYANHINLEQVGSLSRLFSRL